MSFVVSQHAALADGVVCKQCDSPFQPRDHAILEGTALAPMIQSGVCLCISCMTKCQHCDRQASLTKPRELLLKLCSKHLEQVFSEEAPKRKRGLEEDAKEETSKKSKVEDITMETKEEDQEMIPTPDVEEETFRSLLSSVQNNMDRLENNGGADTLEDLCALVSLLQSCLKFLTGADHTDCYTRTMMGSYHLFQSVYHTIDTKVIHNQDNRELTEEAYGLLRELGINDEPDSMDDQVDELMRADVDDQGNGPVPMETEEFKENQETEESQEITTASRSDIFNLFHPTKRNEHYRDTVKRLRDRLRSPSTRQLSAGAQEMERDAWGNITFWQNVVQQSRADPYIHGELVEILRPRAQDALLGCSTTMPVPSTLGLPSTVHNVNADILCADSENNLRVILDHSKRNRCAFKLPITHHAQVEALVNSWINIWWEEVPKILTWRHAWRRITMEMLWETDFAMDVLSLKDHSRVYYRPRFFSPCETAYSTDTSIIKLNRIRVEFKDDPQRRCLTHMYLEPHSVRYHDNYFPLPSPVVALEEFIQRQVELHHLFPLLSDVAIQRVFEFCYGSKDYEQYYNRTRNLLDSMGLDWDHMPRLRPIAYREYLLSTRQQVALPTIPPLDNVVEGPLAPHSTENSLEQTENIVKQQLTHLQQEQRRDFPRSINIQKVLWDLCRHHVQGSESQDAFIGGSELWARKRPTFQMDMFAIERGAFHGRSNNSMWQYLVRHYTSEDLLNKLVLGLKQLEFKQQTYLLHKVKISWFKCHDQVLLERKLTAQAQALTGHYTIATPHPQTQRATAEIFNSWGKRVLTNHHQRLLGEPSISGSDQVYYICVNSYEWGLPPQISPLGMLDFKYQSPSMSTTITLPYFANKRRTSPAGQQSFYLKFEFDSNQGRWITASGDWSMGCNPRPSIAPSTSSSSATTFINGFVPLPKAKNRKSRKSKKSQDVSGAAQILVDMGAQEEDEDSEATVDDPRRGTWRSDSDSDSDSDK